MDTPQEWIVGLDLTPRSRGAARWAAWLSERSSRPPRLVALHAGELTDFKEAHPGPGSPYQRACLSTAASLRANDVEDAFDHVRVADLGSAAEALSDAAARPGSRGLIVGRNQPADSWTLISLGHVARRVLRMVDDPVFVVPPDHEPPQAPGPIVVGVTPSDDALAAVHMARALAADLDLALEYVHVLPTGSFFMRVADYDAGRMPGLGQSHHDFERGAKAALRRWSSQHGLELPVRFEVGEPAEALTAAAGRLHASMVVTGSRQLSTIERLFQRSVGSDVAARAQVPTLVVPPTALERAAAS